VTGMDEEDIDIEDELNARLTDEPFQRFYIFMASGDRFEIDDKKHVSVGKWTINIYGSGSGVIVLRKSELIGLELP
jgi:hypothetical protein